MILLSVCALGLAIAVVYYRAQLRIVDNSLRIRINTLELTKMNLKVADRNLENAKAEAAAARSCYSVVQERLEALKDESLSTKAQAIALDRAHKELQATAAAQEDWWSMRYDEVMQEKKNVEDNQEYLRTTLRHERQYWADSLAAKIKEVKGYRDAQKRKLTIRKKKATKKKKLSSR